MVTRWFWGGVLVRHFQISFVSGVVSLAHNSIAASGPFLEELGASLWAVATVCYLGVEEVFRSRAEV